MSTSYPTLQRVLEMMLNDQGMDTSSVTFDSIDWTDERAPSNDFVQLDRVEAALATLSNEELETLAIGDQEDWPVIMVKFPDEAEMVHIALECMFGATA